MPEITHLFVNRKVAFDKLAPFGFAKKGNDYIYRQKILGEQFELVVMINSVGKVFSLLNDTVAGEEYVLHLVPGATGAFVGQVRQEYENVLAAIGKACFESDVFKSELADKVIRYIAAKYNDEPEFLWEKFSGNAIFRRKDNRKWYVALLTVGKEKLGLPGNEKIEIIDVRATPENIELRVDGTKYFYGYHMNKKHWLTVCLDGSVDAADIFKRIDESYDLAFK